MNIQHTMTFHPSNSLHAHTQIELDNLDALEDAELDELPYGVIGLHASGTILRYNIAEAKFARLDRTTVIGKNFFGEVAPCTATPEFKGRFDAYLRASSRPDKLSFTYTFDFKFGAQDVDIEILPASGNDRYYLLINRQKFLDPRPDLPPGFAAPLHQELVLPQDELGVFRDHRSQRDLKLPIIWLSSLLQTCDKVAPDTWGLFAREWGQRFGRLASIDLEVECLEQHGHSLRDSTMEQAAAWLAERMADQGWGGMQFDFSLAARGAIVVHLHNSAVARASRKQGVRRCHLVAGYLSAVLSHLAQRRLFVEESYCVCQGHDHCEFVVVGEKLHPKLEELVNQSPSTAQRCFEILEAQDDR